MTTDSHKRITRWGDVRVTIPPKTVPQTAGFSCSLTSQRKLEDSNPRQLSPPALFSKEARSQERFNFQTTAENEVLETQTLASPIPFPTDAYPWQVHSPTRSAEEGRVELLRLSTPPVFEAGVPPLRLHLPRVGVTGIEPAITWTQTKRPTFRRHPEIRRDKGCKDGQPFGSGVSTFHHPAISVDWEGALLPHVLSDTGFSM